MHTSYDVIVIGAGSMGMSAGAHLAQRGRRVLLIDAFDPPHTGASHHGETRLLRHAYTGGPTYVRMALRAHELWNELEAATGRELFRPTGVLNMTPASHPSLLGKLEASKAFDLNVEWLSAEEIGKRWPGITPPEHYVGLYEKDAGVLLSEECVRAYREVALAHGALLLPYTRVTGITPLSRSVTVSTPVGDFHAEKLILTAGAGAGSIPRFPLPVKAVRKTVGWFRAEERLFGSEHFPGFTIGGSMGGYYGFPSFGGSGLKIGRHDTGRLIEEGEAPEAFGAYPEDEGDLRSALAAYLPSAAGPLLRGGICRYERSPDEHFIIDRAPVLPGVYFASGFSGHGFKFASVVGEILADLITKGSCGFDLQPFLLSRFRKGAVQAHEPA
ncbi:N-methyl-L-tryptophan oxidase [Paenibacillus mucilaginosus]|uniref:Monomeric sarcosine oxidase n=1 Tax=Paenibacillus mucilaginosus (strain KNP414) TaxID=1036673 RepID=F8FLD1_PAEMK|nr:N-methyl-L-tryptophan oxidase [Paenibacillus mucilaginosus]AEI43499.1 monomeric sarcosine oxidase [Paenibacillus mucilaginosus KNP414]MCG7211957.1 N-methyl-L-tryptophan oxidase [Paenibacillus mucilaginosus]WDM25051.1 N-methyl-L-tryptophan oxidase [Paenibacillus mucilaginosus]